MQAVLVQAKRPLRGPALAPPQVQALLAVLSAPRVLALLLPASQVLVLALLLPAARLLELLALLPPLPPAAPARGPT